MSPLLGREFESLGRKEYGGEYRVSFLDKKGRQCEIPLSWTDLAPEDALTTLADGKSYFRAADSLGTRTSYRGFAAANCKVNFVPCDKEISSLTLRQVLKYDAVLESRGQTE